MHYLGNAFSLGMMDEPHAALGTPFALRVVGLTLEQARAWLAQRAGWVSCVGHSDTALLLSELLGVHVPMRRETTSLVTGDALLVAQYTGPRLPEGAVKLPEGAKLRWFLLELPEQQETGQ
jgi:hypothetical protein